METGTLVLQLLMLLAGDPILLGFVVQCRTSATERTQPNKRVEWLIT